MKVFLAGCEDKQFVHLTEVAQHPYALFSYFHWSDISAESKAYQRDTLNRNNMEVICDSGLFTLMFGVGKGGSYDLPFMKAYTQKYISIAHNMGINKLTIVESDVHKLLGMPAVFELRKFFEDSGLPVLYVWHKEEGVDGLLRMAEKYDYIALSVPELRILFKGQKQRYQDVVKSLLSQIRAHVGELKMPKIHLLGNTVQETMETPLAYSCDSTSWLSAGRFGVMTDFRNGKLTQIRRTSPYYLEWREKVWPRYSNAVSAMAAQYGHNPRYLDYQIANLYTALTMRRYQDHLDKFFPWVGLRRASK